MKKPTKQDLIIMAFILILGALFYHGATLIANYKKKQHTKPQVANSAKLDSMLLDAFCIGEKRGVSEAIKEITIYRNNPNTTKIIYEQMKVDSINFKKELK